MHVFDRRAVRRHRDRAAPGLGAADFLFRESAERLLDRLNDVTHRFPLALDLGCHGGTVGALLTGSAKIDRLIQCDVSPAMARAARGNGRVAFVADEEALPVADGALDLVISNLSLHWVNDLPGALIQIRRALKPDGLFLASVFGLDTLKELRASLLEAEAEISGGAGRRVSPFTDVRDAGGLLSRAGFALPVVDLDTITTTYTDMFRLMADLRAMGETNAAVGRRPGASRRDVFTRAAEIYAARYSDPRGRIVATFQIITQTAWAPHPRQQKALRPGSAEARLADALGATETKMSQGTPP
ncbi:MAG: methyltransferase domain-containing protein [Alphaproteobacteria bacterium]|nr:methyltransferase domain-containing protein [Alphaproteobacteria bacterium]